MNDSGRNEPRKLRRKSPGFNVSGVAHALNATGGRSRIKKESKIINTGLGAGNPNFTTLPNPVEGGGVHNALNADSGGKIKLQCTTINAGAFAWSSDDPQRIPHRRNCTTITRYASSSCSKNHCEKGSNVSGVVHALNATHGGSIEGNGVTISVGLGAGNPNITALPNCVKRGDVHDALNADLYGKINLECAIINDGALARSSSHPQNISIQPKATYKRSHTKSSRCASSSCPCDGKGSNVSGVVHALNSTHGGSIEGNGVIISVGLGAGNPNITALPNCVKGGGVHDALNADLDGKIDLECAIVNAGALARSSSDL